MDLIPAMFEHNRYSPVDFIGASTAEFSPFGTLKLERMTLGRKGRVP